MLVSSHLIFNANTNCIIILVTFVRCNAIKYMDILFSSYDMHSKTHINRKLNQETTERNAVNIFFDWPQFGYCVRNGRHDTFLSVHVRVCTRLLIE